MKNILSPTALESVKKFRLKPALKYQKKNTKI